MDCFHFGHVNFLRQCKELCRKKFPELNPYFIAGLISDEKCNNGLFPLWPCELPK